MLRSVLCFDCRAAPGLLCSTGGKSLLLFPACTCLRCNVVCYGTEIRAVASLPCCFLQVREGGFSGAAFGLSPSLGMWVTAFAPYCLLCAAPVVANAPNGALPQTPLGLCPRPRKPLARGLTARFNALRDLFSPLLILPCCFSGLAIFHLMCYNDIYSFLSRSYKG